MSATRAPGTAPAPPPAGAQPTAPTTPSVRAATSWFAVWWPAAAVAVALVVGGVLRLGGLDDAGAIVWGAAIAGSGASMVREVVQGLRRREPGVDVIALLALIGAVLLGELLAGVIIALMLASGRALERYAGERARRELTALLEAAPRTAHLRRDGTVLDVEVGQVQAGDVVLVRPGETVPVDGVVLAGRAVLDESTITGEARPVERETGARLASGAVNAGAPFELRAAATAARSTYAGIIRLVEQAQAERAPFVRLADRAAVVFVPLTLLVAGAAWALSGDPVRALAVLVVATPCPLILATPVAITSGISRLARRGVIVKGGGALEALARTRQVLLDKTGTVTRGQPRVVEVRTFGTADPDEVLRAAGAVEQLSAHVFAPAIVTEARSRNLALPFPSDVTETAGAGISGTVEGREVRLGRAEWVVHGPTPVGAKAVRRRTQVEGTSAVFVSIDGVLTGALLLEDRLRAEAGRTIRLLRAHGVERVTLLTGDHADVAELVGAAVDVDRVLAQRSPEDKVEAVRAAREDSVVAMVGDGVNDAPALAQADVGVAMGAAGATASSEAADIVITVDRFDRLAEAVVVAQRTRAIAWSSIRLGMGLAAVAMLFAAFGYLPPVAGALVQEAIDVLAIANALRALRGRSVSLGLPAHATEATLHALAEHGQLQSGIDRLASTAARLPEHDPAAAREALHQVLGFLRDDLLPHEQHEERTVYPLLAGAGAEDRIAPLRHTHREITRYVRLLDSSVEQLPPDGPSELELADLQRLLYGLHAILQLHTAQEEELYGTAVDRAPASTTARPPADTDADADA